ncbi:hypothetical protein ABGB07_03770 [Micromonosporaceae bacterium B7E4]
MTTPDLFDTPTSLFPGAGKKDTPTSPACRRCGVRVLRVRDAEIGISVDLDPESPPITVPLPADRIVIEHHPKAGWHHPPVTARRGYPVHLLHQCEIKPEDPKTGENQS